MKKIYLDYNATYPTTSAHFDQLGKLLSEHDGNPSTLHYMGRRARIGMEKSREKIASYLGAQRKQIIFTSGATESNNLVLKSYFENISTPQVYASSIEHPSVAETLRIGSEKGRLKLTLLSVDRQGHVDQEQVLNSLPEHGPALVTIMYANNEVGCINPVFQLAKKVKEKNPDIYFHSDMAQALGKIDLRELATSTIDSAAFSGHKIGSLKGIGCLYLRDSQSLRPLFHGGNQESGLRSGTENIAGILSFALACDGINEALAARDDLRQKSEYFIQGLTKGGRVVVHSDPNVGLVNTINCYFHGYTASEIFSALDQAGVAVTTGSACSSGKSQASPVLKALGYNETESSHSVRFSLSHLTTMDELNEVIRILQPFITSKN